MFQSTADVATELNFYYLALSFLILVAGCYSAFELLDRARKTSDSLKKIWVLLAGLMGGGSIWCAHFIGIIAFKNALIIGYDPFFVLLSLGTVISFTIISFSTIAHGQSKVMQAMSGLIFGLGLAAMQNTGMSSMTIAGWIDWNIWGHGISILLACILSAVAVVLFSEWDHSIRKPISSGFACLAALTVQFFCMYFMQLVPLDTQVSSVNLLSDSALGTTVSPVALLLFVCAYFSKQLSKISAEKSYFERQMTYKCQLTGALNRLGMENRVQTTLKKAKQEDDGFALIHIDLDRFKQINDVKGHAAGDSILRELSQRLSEELFHNDALGRMSGDEFIVIKSACNTNQEALRFCETIKHIISNEISWNNGNLSTSASIGYALFPYDGQNAEELFAFADLAMHRAKINGKDRIARYSAKMDQAHRERSALAQKFEAAIRGGKIDVHYQQQNNSHCKSICGVEALARWHDDEFGHISPARFIPIAEETGLILRLGDYVLEKACREAMNWPQTIGLAVNVASAQLMDTEFPMRVRRILKRTGFPPQRLELEITESSIIADREHALQVVRLLKQIGIRIVMDDFGTGYSSLATLHNFPFDKIKIDREFVQSIHENPQTESIVKSTIFLAKSLDINILAEGVENEKQLNFLNEQGCREVQGFFFGKPVPAVDMRAVLARINNVESVAV